VRAGGLRRPADRSGGRRVPGVNRLARTAAAAAVALALAGCATSTAGTGRIAADATRGAAEGAGADDPAGTPAPTGSTGAAGRTATLGKATIPLTGVAKAAKDGDYLCLTLVDDTGCGLEVIDIGATRAAGGSVSNPAPGAPNGWWWGSDVPSCGSGTDVSAVTTSTVLEKGFKPVGSKTAAYGHWQVSCQNADQNFDPRLWWLPTSQLAFRQRSTVAGGGEAVDKILAGVTFGS
jgi:hypothetical protein